MAHTRWVERQMERWLDAPDLLPIGTPREHHVHTMPVPDLSTPVHACTLTQLRERVRYLEIQAAKANAYTEELERVRKSPHLYDEWHVDMVTEFAQIERERYLTAEGLIEWDCGTCGTWQVSKEADGSATPCYVCGP